MKTWLTGAFGELACAKHLREHGYEILSCNYKSRFGEIDLIAGNRKIIAFVEVKTRKNDSFATALENVTLKKRAKIIKTASSYLVKSKDTRQPRFDVCEVYYDQIDGLPQLVRLNYIENAFC